MKEVLGLFWPDESSRRWCNESAAGKMELPPGAKESQRHSTIKVLQSAQEPHTEGVLQSPTMCYKVLRSTTKCQGAVHRLSEYCIQSTTKCQADGNSGVTMMGARQ